MTQLLTTEDGRNAAIVAKKFLLQRRLSRFFKSRLPIAVEEYENTGVFDLATLLGQLNDAHDPEILTLFRLLGLSGGLGETVADMEIHVDGTAGSDETGDGTAASPFQTLWFFDFLPKRVKHKIDIVFTGNVGDGTFDMVFDHVFSGNGCINIIGSGAPTQIAGPFTVTAVTNFAGGIAATSIDSNIAPGAAYEGMFVQAADGADQGKAAAVYDVAAGSTVIQTGPVIFNGLAPADQINIVEPTPVLTLHSLYGYASGEKNVWSFSYRRNRIVFMNMKLVLPNDQESEERFVWNNRCHTQFSFVQANVTSFAEAHINLYGYVNDGASVSTNVEALANSGVQNLNDEVTGSHSTMAGMTIATNTPIYTRGESKIKRVSMPPLQWYFEKANAELEYCFADWYESIDSQTNFSNCLGRGRQAGAAPFNGCAFYARRSHMTTYYCSCLTSNNMFGFVEGSRGLIAHTDLDATFTVVRYCIYCEGLAQVEFIGDETNPNAIPSEDGICFQGFDDLGSPGDPWEDPWAIDAVDGASHGGALFGMGAVVQHTRLFG